MKRKALLTFFILSALAYGELQAQTHTCEASRRLCYKLDKNNGKLTAEEKSEFLVFRYQGEDYVRGLIRARDKSAMEALFAAKRVSVNSKTATIYSIQAPLNAICELANAECVNMFELDRQAAPCLDSLRKDMQVDLVYQGLDLPKGFTGKGVVVGIVDRGFDYTHPTMFDTSGANYRVSRVWEQNGNGTPPTGFTYGNLLANGEAVYARLRDTINQMHGLHVAAIAAGGGQNTNGKYRGVAPEAEIAIASINYTWTSIADAVNFLANYALETQKPTVINLSLGGFNGATMDGTSLRDKVIEEVANLREGLAVVVSAGNSAYYTMHAMRDFAGDTLRTIAHPGDSTDFFGNYTNNNVCRMIAFGEEGNDFSLQLRLANTLGNEVANLGYFTAFSDTVFDTTLTILNSHIPVSVVCYKNYPTNNKPAIYVSSSKLGNRAWLVALTAANSRVHLWNVGNIQGNKLTNKSPNNTVLAGYVSGDTRYTVSEPGTSFGAITIAAHTTKNQYIDANGTLRNIGFNQPIGTRAVFSSIGPTWDGRLKPDLSAPGNAVAAAFNHYDATWDSANLVDTSGFENCGQYIAIQGTSMSAPAVAGLVALILEQNPYFTYEQIRAILQNTARKDTFTSDSVNFEWGYGKADAYAALKMAIDSTTKVSSEREQNFVIFPNPTKGKIWIQTQLKSEYKLALTDLTGKLVFSKNGHGENNIECDLSKLPKGLYLLNLTQGFARVRKKIILE